MTVLEKETTSNGEWNFNMIVTTCRTLAGSQGFYGRLLNTIENMTDDEKANAIKALDKVAKFNDTLDAVMYLEG